MRLVLAGACLVVACVDAPPATPRPDPDLTAALTARAQVIGAAVRAAAACDQPLGATAQDHAARLETAVLVLHQATGGDPARDAFLASMRPPHAPTLRARAAWCAGQRRDLGGVERFLIGADGLALIAQAEAEAK